MKNFKIVFAIMLVCVMVFSIGCTSSNYSYSDTVLSKEEALIELEALLADTGNDKERVNVTTVSNPTMDIYYDNYTEADSLADISVFPIVVQGKGEINIEIAVDTELSTPVDDENKTDDLLIVWGNKFNNAHYTFNGKWVTVTIRQITGGEVVTYMRNGKYRPDFYIPSHAAWGKMLEASGIPTITMCDRLFGNTAGILMSDKIYDSYIEKYGEITIAKVIEANQNGDIVFAYTNPYTSSTGLNMLTMILKAFDPSNPVSQTAAEKLNAYQRTSPPTAYTTGVMRNKAAKGLIDAMVMEEQAYINTKQLANYIYVPAGIRHDHPVFTFDYVSNDKQEAAKIFIDYCLSDEIQKAAYEKGFNRHNDYVGEEPGLDGAGYLAAQSLWYENKNGGIPVVAVVVCDISGSMVKLNGNSNIVPINAFKKAITATASNISYDSYVGLVSYSTDVKINLPIRRFDDKQRAYFSGEIKNMMAEGYTSTYSALLVATQMIEEFGKTLEDYRPLIILVTDGDQNWGWNFNRAFPVLGGMQIPIYTILYNYNGNAELEKLSNVTAESSVFNSTSEDLVNQLRGLFIVEG